MDFWCVFSIHFLFYLFPVLFYSGYSIFDLIWFSYAKLHCGLIRGIFLVMTFPMKYIKHRQLIILLAICALAHHILTHYHLRTVIESADVYAISTSRVRNQMSSMSSPRHTILMHAFGCYWVTVSMCAPCTVHTHIYCYRRSHLMSSHVCSAYNSLKQDWHAIRIYKVHSA